MVGDRKGRDTDVLVASTLQTMYKCLGFNCVCCGIEQTCQTMKKVKTIIDLLLLLTCIIEGTSQVPLLRRGLAEVPAISTLGPCGRDIRLEPIGA